MVLDKLRRLYELVRFAEMTPAVQESEPEMAMSIDLDDVLLPGVQFVPEVAPEDAAEQSPALTPAPDAQELAAPHDPASDDLSAPQPEFAPLPVLEEPPVQPVSEAGFLPETETSFAQSIPGTTAAQAAPATLFGVEEDDVERHRRKQRVIMSLYHTETPVAAERSAPAPAAVEKSTPSPAPEDAQKIESTPETVMAAAPISERDVETRTAQSDPETEFEEFSVETLPANEVVTGSDAAPADESFEVDTDQEQAPDADGDTDAGAITNSSTEPAPKAASGSVLGDVINHDVQTLADTFAPRRDTLSEAAHRAHIDDLRAAIGINDRFLLVRDLFDGDAAACDAALETLNAFGNLDDCMIHIAENYTWNPNSDGVKLLTELLERKHA